ncbi:MAG TPA: type II toxin-antitoxin system VapC family toxin [Nitrososphaerales archaeon]|nr:type II toxin-antitoxin system VapC family toxin [Nitrososphaerales archaeon]
MIFDITGLIQAIRKKSDFEEGSTSIITLIEVLRGIEDTNKREKTSSLLQQAFEIVDVNREVARAYLKLYFELKRNGESSSDADELIAATALSQGEALLTSDKGFPKFDPLIKVKLVAE